MSQNNSSIIPNPLTLPPSMDETTKTVFLPIGTQVIYVPAFTNNTGFKFNPLAPVFTPGVPHMPINPTVQAPAHGNVRFGNQYSYNGPPVTNPPVNPLQPPVQFVPGVGFVNGVAHVPTTAPGPVNMVGGFFYGGRSREQIKEDNEAEQAGGVNRRKAVEEWAPRGNPEDMFQVKYKDGKEAFYPLAVINSWGRDAGRWYQNGDRSEAWFDHRR
jgi:hypothetical protein